MLLLVVFGVFLLWLISVFSRRVFLVLRLLCLLVLMFDVFCVMKICFLKNWVVGFCYLVEGLGVWLCCC